MTPTELKLIKQIAEDAAASRSLLETHTTQIALIFEELRAHADKLTVLQTKQELHLQQSDPGNASERMGVRVAIGCALLSMLWQLIELLK